MINDQFIDGWQSVTPGSRKGGGGTWDCFSDVYLQQLRDALKQEVMRSGDASLRTLTAGSALAAAAVVVAAAMFLGTVWVCRSVASSDQNREQEVGWWTGAAAAGSQTRQEQEPF